MLRAGRETSVPKACSSFHPRKGWCVVSLVLSVSSSASRASLEEHPWEETFWVPDLRTGHVVWWRATQPPQPFLGFRDLFLDTFVQISWPLTASQVAWF